MSVPCGSGWSKTSGITAVTAGGCASPLTGSPQLWGTLTLVLENQFCELHSLVHPHASAGHLHCVCGHCPCPSPVLPLSDAHTGLSHCSHSHRPPTLSLVTLQKCEGTRVALGIFVPEVHADRYAYRSFYVRFYYFFHPVFPSLRPTYPPIIFISFQHMTHSQIDFPAMMGGW